MTDLPVAEIVPALLSALKQHEQVILQAPPGSGKSTWLPLQLLADPKFSGKKLLMLEPRRLAARAVAQRLAEQLGEKPGQQVGYRVRGETRVSKATRLEVVTEGILIRMLQQDPELEGIGLVIFDEFHERSLQADLALAFTLEAQQVFAPELKLLLMSATLDDALLRRLLPEAQTLSCDGRLHPVTHHYRPWNRQQPLIPAIGAVVLEALNALQGDGLVFLPGELEILRLVEWLEPRVSQTILLCPLYGRLPFEKQQQAIRPCVEGRRKVVVTTNIAETSLTIEGVHWVVDSGLERREAFSARDGIAALEQRQISRSSAHQRAGRAGRLGPGDCYRLWEQQQHQRLEAQRPAAISRNELCQLVLEAALWGSSVCELPLPEQPPGAHLQHARQLLERFELLDKRGILSSLGRRVAALGAHPRLGYMLIEAQSRASECPGILGDACYLLAALELGITGSGEPLSVSIGKQLPRLTPYARRWFDKLGVTTKRYRGEWIALLLAIAYPDRISRLAQHRYQLSSGIQGELSRDSALQGSPGWWWQSCGVAVTRSVSLGRNRLSWLSLRVNCRPFLVSTRSWGGMLRHSGYGLRFSAVSGGSYCSAGL
ncbi:ATP-dependent helicase HrpB [Dongshaea marina]|uniref:ATP-dependent helicase HrpB n=1 Tax=Dongshaea marina TaxID=2047966 RepID=UPI002D77B61E|nr:ATP-dependent helicase HrpB [Dongshaea marina]